MGMFDDLIPQDTATKPKGMFDDLIPAAPKVKTSKEFPWSADNPPPANRRQNFNNTKTPLRVIEGIGSDMRDPKRKAELDAMFGTIEERRAKKPKGMFDDLIPAKPAEADMGTLSGDLEASWYQLRQAMAGIELMNSQRAIDTADDQNYAPKAKFLLGGADKVKAKARLTQDKAVQDIGTMSDKIKAIPESPAATKFNKSKTFTEGWNNFWADPLTVTRSTTARSAAISLPSVVGGIVGSVVGPAGAAAGAGIGSYTAELGSAIAEGLATHGADLSNPESIKKVWAIHKDAITKTAHERAMIVGGADAITGGVSSKVAALPGIGIIKKELLGTATEMAGGGIGEAAAQYNEDGTVRPGAILGEIVGEGGAGAVQQTGQIAVEGVKKATGAKDDRAPPEEKSPITPPDRVEPRIVPPAGQSGLPPVNLPPTPPGYTGPTEAATPTQGQAPAAPPVGRAPMAPKEIKRPVASPKAQETAPLTFDDLIPAKPEADAPKPAEGVSFIITKAQKQEMARRGYTVDQIKNMAPAKAHAILREPAPDAFDQFDAEPSQKVAEGSAPAAQAEAPVATISEKPADVSTGARQAPVKAVTATELAPAREQVNTEPSEAQAKAGNYKKGHARVAGLDVTIENPRGSTRRGVSPDGTPWEAKLPVDYGYVKKAEGADGDKFDVYLGPDLEAPSVFVIDQIDLKTGKYDEGKGILGARSEEDARNIYAEAFSDGKGMDRIGHIQEMPVAEFKKWAMSGGGKKPLKPKAAIRRADTDDDTAITASGREVPVKYSIVEAADLVASERDEGGANPDYPEELQPRDRDRAVSQQQIQDIAQRLDPRLLGKSPKASDGSPIISEDGTVESGNGRVLAIRRAYAQNMPGAAKYREHLASQGYLVEGMKAPVLVRVRQGQMKGEDRQAFTREANERDTLAMSATERAMSDAKAMPDQVLEQYRGGEVNAADNRGFVRSFIRDVVGKNDQANLIAADGSISQEAIRRIESALLAKAYGDEDLIAKLVESPDNNIRAIGGALLDVAPAWAQMRAEASSGDISPDVDQTKNLLAAIRMVERARTENTPLSLLVGQNDIFSGTTMEPLAEAFLSLMFRNTTDWKQPVGRAPLAEALGVYVTEARKTSSGTDLLGMTAAEPSDIVALARRKQKSGETDASDQPKLDLAKPARERPGESAGPPSEPRTPPPAPREEAAASKEPAPKSEPEVAKSTFKISGMLTPAEQESLRQDLKEASAAAQKAFAKNLPKREPEAKPNDGTANDRIPGRTKPVRPAAEVDELPEAGESDTGERTDQGGPAKTGERDDSGEKGGSQPKGDKGILANIGRDVTGSPAFKAWFGNSKVVDENGKPMVVYHGTAKAGFDEFDTYGSNYGLMGQGAYFTENPAVASEYTDKGIVGMQRKGDGVSQAVIPAYLSIKNPIDMNTAPDTAAWAKAFGDYIDESDIADLKTNEEAYRFAEDAVIDEGYPKWEGAEIMQDGLRSMGFDGITHIGGGRVDKNGARHRVWVAFDPEQIKSAIGNKGTFDPGNKSILASRAMTSGFFTGPSRAEITELQAKIDKLSDKILGHRIKTKLTDRIRDREGKDTGMLAAFDPNTMSIEIALSHAHDFIESFGHESLHALRDLGVFTKPEWRLLVEEAKRGTVNGQPVMERIRERYDAMYRKSMDLTEAQHQDLLEEEAVAFMMGAHVAGKIKLRSGVARLIDKIHQFLEAILNAAKGYGFRTGRGVIADIQSGKMKERPTSEGEGRGYGLKRRYNKDRDLFPTEPGAEGLPQTIILGAERVSDKNLAELRAKQPLRATANQKPMDIGLFGDEKNQGELFNAPPSEPAPDPSDMGKDEASKDALEHLAGNINLHYLLAPEDIKQALRDISEKAKGFIDARRGVQTNEMTRQLAKEMGMKPSELLARKEGVAFNAEGIFAARVMMMKSIKRLASMAAQASKSQSLADAAEFMKAYTRHVAIQEQIAGITAEAGRALQQFKMMAGDSYFQAAERIIDAAKSKDKKRPMGAKNKLGQDAAIDLAQMINALNDPAQISKFTREAFKVTIFDMIREYWINALLSSPSTHATNILSNTITALWQVPETAVASAIGLLHGGEKVRVMETMARLEGLLEGTKDGLIAGWATLKTGEPTDLASKLENHRKKAIPSVIGSIIRTPGTMLMAEDDVFKAMNYRAELHALATRHAMKQGLKEVSLSARIAELLQNPPASMKKAAHEAAVYNTFQTKLGPIGSYVMGLREKIPGAYLIAPFIRTPANLIKYAAERTPLGLAMGSVRDNLSGKNGNVARDTQISRMALGSAIAAVVASYVMAGMISGSGPDDPDERNVLRAAGWQPYSVNIGGTWYSYQRFDPFAMIVGITADMVELGEAVSEADAGKIGAMIISSISGNLLDKTWLNGPSDFIAAIQEPKRYGDQYVRRFAGSLVPALFSKVNQTYFDPVVRDARSMLDTIKSRLPYYSQALPPRRNIFGEEIRREGALGPDILSTVFMSTDKENPIAKEMVRLNYFPSMPRREINGNPLTPEQYDQYTEIAGKQAVKLLERKVALPGWQRRQPDDNIKIIKDAYDKAREQARNQMKRQYPKLRKKPK